MVELNLNIVGDYLIGQIREIMIGGDQTVPVDHNKFISWCLPGIPFSEGDFDFAAMGLGTTTDAEEYKAQLQHAYNFAQAVDFIPDITQVYDSNKQEQVYSSSQARLSEMYKQILNLSKVVNREISDEDKKTIEEYRAYLTTTTKVKNLTTKEETEVTIDGPVMQAYNDKMLAFIDACIEYNSKRAAAQSAPPGPEGMPAIADFSNNEPLYRIKIRAAKDAWARSGYMNEVDQMHAFIDQVTRRNMMLWKRMLIDNLEKAQQAALGAGLDFYYTSPIPGGFAKSTGWLTKTFKRSHFESQAALSSEYADGSSGSSGHSSQNEAASSAHHEAASNAHNEAASSAHHEAASNAHNDAGSSSSSKKASVGGSYGLFSGSASYGSSNSSAHSSADNSSHSSADNSAHSSADNSAHSSAGSSGENSYKSNLSENSIMSGDSKISDIEVSFEITQVLISRPWFYPEFFMNRGWTLRKGDGWELDMPSDGNIPEPNGTFIAYPTAALFVRNVTIKSKEIASAYKAYKERKASLSIGSQSSSAHSNESGSAHSSESGSAHSSESGSAHSGESGSAQSSESDRSSRGGKVGANYGIGCFSIGGGYSSSSSNEHSSGSSDAHNSGSSDAHNSGSSDAHNSGSSNAHGSGHSEDHSSNLSSAGRESLQGAQWESTVNGDTITIPGMQIVGFICQFFGKAPNPDPELKDTDFS